MLKSSQQDQGTGALAAVHGHIDSGRNASNGMVDNPRLNGGLGNAEPLKLGLPNATVSHGQVGWREMDRGRLQFSYPDGAMNRNQIADTQSNLDVEQKLFQ
jgi:hypothetical protein